MRADVGLTDTAIALIVIRAAAERSGYETDVAVMSTLKSRAGGVAGAL
jgi:hypothetical protein